MFAHRPDRLTTLTWLGLVAITVVSWWLSPAGRHVEPSVGITVLVIALSAVKVRLIISNFMEVRTAPVWLRRATDAWQALLWASVLVIYLW